MVNPPLCFLPLFGFQLASIDCHQYVILITEIILLICVPGDEVKRFSDSASRLLDFNSFSPTFFYIFFSTSDAQLFKAPTGAKVLSFVSYFLLKELSLTQSQLIPVVFGGLPFPSFFTLSFPFSVSHRGQCYTFSWTQREVGGHLCRPCDLKIAKISRFKGST